MPSVFALRDVRRRIRRSLGPRLADESSLAKLLALDPPTVLRALRAAAAPIYETNRTTWTVPALLQVLGPSLTRRSLDVSPIDGARTEAVRKLWLHAVATAHAARILADSSGLMPSDEAYLLGLLHDLPRWLDVFTVRTPGISPHSHASELLRHWNLPARFCERIESAASERAHFGDGVQPEDPETLICAAELLAELADFGHPDSDPTERDMLLAACGKEELVTAQRLRREVETRLREVGLDLSVAAPELEGDQPRPDEDLELFTGKQRGDLSEIVLNVLSCSKSASYRGIVTAITSAALRYARYDRAFYVKWIGRGDRVAVRAKADLSSRRIVATSVTLRDVERDGLQIALDSERPRRLDAQRNGGPGLLRLLGVDEALVVAVNRDFDSPAFLVLDRALSTRPLHLVHDGDMATTLGVTASLLNDNLLLRLNRQRALKFALTDPLTRLYNRRMGINTLEQEITRARRTELPLTVLMIDLDHFKRLNDVHGHIQGDHALRAVAEVLRKTLRRTDTICRYGGEEFMVVLPDTAAEDAAVLAARLFTAVEARGNELDLPTTVSVGLAAMRPDDQVESLLQRADQALYASKSTGRNRFSVDV